MEPEGFCKNGLQKRHGQKFGEVDGADARGRVDFNRRSGFFASRGEERRGLEEVH